MANTSARTLRLLSLLQNHRYWSGTDLAQRLGISPRTVRRDVDRLRELGYPVESSRGVDGGYQLAAGAALPPLVLDNEEAVALVVGLQVAAQSAVAGIAESSVRALAKVVQVLPPRLRREAEALRSMTVPAPWERSEATVDPALLVTIAQVCRDDQRLEFSYTSRGGDHTERCVEPNRLVLLGRRWYLVAFDPDRDAWRSFRVDRITAPRALRGRFEPRELPATDAAAFVREGIERQTSVHEIEVIVDAPAPVVTERIGRWARVESIDDGHSRVRMTTDSFDWPIFALGVLGAEFTVVEPPELTVQLREWGARFR